MPLDPISVPSPAEESQAVRAARHGDMGRLGHLLEVYRPRLERMIAFRMDPLLRGRLDPGDVLQECYAEVIDRLADYPRDPEEGLFLWVRFLAHQRLKQLHRLHLDAGVRDARMEVPFDTSSATGASSFALASALLAVGGTPSHLAREDERRVRLHEALEGMKVIDREILMLRHFEHLSNGEAAKLLSLTDAGASLRYLRALGRLREVLVRVDLASGVPLDD